MDKFAKLNQAPENSEQALPAVEVNAQVQIPLHIVDLYLKAYSPETVEIEVEYGPIKVLTFHKYMPMEVKHLIVESAISLGQDYGKYYSHINGMVMFLQYYLKDSQLTINDITTYSKSEKMSIFDFFVSSNLVSKIEEQCPFLFFEIDFINSSINDRYFESLQKANTAKEIVDHMFFKLGEGILELGDSLEALSKKSGNPITKIFNQLSK